MASQTSTATDRRARRSAYVKVLAPFCFFLLSVGLSSPSAAAGPKKIRLAYAGWDVGTAVAYVGIDAGLFKKHDLEVQEVFIGDALSGGIQSLLGVDLVLGYGHPVTIVKPIVDGADLVFLGSHFTMEQYRMGVSPEITGIRDLRGKKIAVSGLGRKSDLVARVLLRRAGLDPVDDVQVVQVGYSTQRLLALSKKFVQGAPLNPPTAAQAKNLGFKILEAKDVPVISTLLITTRSLVKKDEEAVRRFIKGYSASIHYFLTHREEALAIMKKYIRDIDDQSLAGMYDSFASQLRPIPDFDGESTQALIDATAVVDDRARKLKPSDLYDSRFLKELIGSGFIKSLYAEKMSL